MPASEQNASRDRAKTRKGYRPLEIVQYLRDQVEKPRRSILSVNSLKKRRAKRLLRTTDRLHLGCGAVHIDGFINIDAVALDTVDFRCRINRLYDYFDPNSVSEIYICHTLEHIAWRLVPFYLEQFHTILKEHGILRISVPDVEKVIAVAKRDSLSDREVGLLQGVMSGGQGYRYNYHMTMFWPEYLRRLLERAGFCEIQEYPLRPHFAGDDVEDGSSAAGFDPFGVGLSLNMMGRK